MALVTEQTGLHSDSYTGKFDEPYGYGCAVYGRSRYGDVNVPAGVYQKHRNAKGTVLSRHFDNYSYPGDTEAAVRRRTLFRAGMLAWQALDTETKQEYNRRKYPPGLSGHNRFLKEYLKAHH